MFRSLQFTKDCHYYSFKITVQILSCTTAKKNVLKTLSTLSHTARQSDNFYIRLTTTISCYQQSFSFITALLILNATCVEELSFLPNLALVQSCCSSNNETDMKQKRNNSKNTRKAFVSKMLNLCQEICGKY